MSMRFGWVASVLSTLALCFLIACGKSSTTSTVTMYVATQGSAQIWGYRSNINSGELSTINGSPFAGSAGATAIVTDPSRSFAYVANAAPTNTIDRYSLDLSGTLVPISGSQSVGTNPVAMAMDSAGKFLFVANRGSNNISVFSVGSNAVLTEVSGSPFSATDPVALAVSPSTTFLYVADQVDGTVLIYQIDPSTGVLSTNLALPPVLAGASPAALALNTSGTFLYVANQGSNNVSAFQIDTTPGNVGNLLTVAGSPFPAGIGPVSAAVDPSGKYLYVVDHASNQLSGYRIAPVTGVLTSVSASPFNTGAGPLFVGISPTNKSLYVSNNSADTISTFNIDPTTGNLGSVSAAVNTGSQPAGIAFGK